MIVKCDSCQTRFRIPDEKVTEKGVKVRCTKCSHTFRVTRPPPEPAASASAADPFAQFGPADDPPMDQATRPGFFASGVAATRADPPRPQSSAPAGGADFSDLFGAPPEPAPEVTATANLSPPQASRRGEPVPARAGADLSDIFNEPTRVAPMPTAPPPQAREEVTVRKAAQDLSRAAQSVPAPKNSSPAEVDFGAPSLAAAPPGPTRPAAEDPFAASPASLLQDVPALDSSELFGGLTGPHAQLTNTGPVELGGFSGEPDHGLFETPAARPAAPSPELFAPPPDPDLAAGPTTPSEGVALGRVTRPAGKPEDARGLDDTRTAGAARRVSGLLANVSIAAALLVVLVTVGSVYLNEGKVELSAISVDRLRELVLPTRQIVTRDVSNGLYDTRTGRPVFFVRGEVENRGEVPGRARVRAEILDGATLVRAVEGLAGAIPSPEELYQVGSAEDVAALTSRLDAASVELAPGARASFLLAFHEYPPDLSSYRLRVTVLPPEPASSAAR